MANTVISFPIPPYANVPIAPQNYQPRVFFITNISLGQTTTITTSANMDYVIGQEVRLLIPNGYGCRELNQQTGLVISIPMPNQVVLNIISSSFTSFVNATFPNKPQIVAIGDVNTGSINANGISQTSTVLPGSFINISPNL